jgi:MFS family permease
VSIAGSGSGRRAALPRLALLFAAHAIGTANIMAVMAFAPAIQADLGIAPATFGLLVAAYFAAQPVVALPAGWLVDRIGVRAALGIAMLTIAAAAALLSRAEGAGMAAAMLVFAGIGYSLVNPATTAGVVAWFAIGWRSTMMSVKQAGVPMGGIIAAAIAAVAGAASWRDASLAVAAAALLTALAALLAPRQQQPAATRGNAGAAPRQAGSFRGVLRSGSLLRVCLATGLLAAAQAGFFAYLVLYLAGPIGLSPAAAAAVFGAVHAASALSRVVWGLLADRWWRGDGKACLRVLSFAGAFGFLALGLAPLGLAQGGLPPVAAAVAAIGAALLLGATVSGFAGVAQSAAVADLPRHQIGTAMGVFMVLTPFGSMAGPPAFGGLLALGDGFLLPNLVLAAAVAGVGVFIARPGRQAAPRPP